MMCALERLKWISHHDTKLKSECFASHLKCENFNGKQEWIAPNVTSPTTDTIFYIFVLFFVFFSFSPSIILYSVLSSHHRVVPHLILSEYESNIQYNVWHSWTCIFIIRFVRLFDAFIQCRSHISNEKHYKCARMEWNEKANRPASEQMRKSERWINQQSRRTIWFQCVT